MRFCNPFRPRRLRYSRVGVILLLSGQAWGRLVAASETPVRDPGNAARPGSPDSTAETAELRILEDLNRPPDAPQGLERLTGPIARHVVTRGLEQALDPQSLRRFGGPGLDLESLRAAVNGDLRDGRRPHLMMAMGLLVHGGLRQVQRVRIPCWRLGAAGSAYGATGTLPTGLPKVSGGIYVLPPRAAGEAPGRRVILTLNSLKIPGLQLPALLHPIRLEVEQVSRSGLAPSATHGAQITFPLRCRGARLGFGAGLSVTQAGKELTRVRTFRPSIAVRRLAVDIELRHVDLGWSGYFDATARTTLRPLLIEGRWRQDPWQRRPPAFEARIRSTELMPYVRWLSGDI